MIEKISSSLVYSMVDGLKSFYEEGKIAGNPIPDKFCDFWEGMIKNKVGVIFSEFRDGEAIGAIGGIVSPDIYDGELVATEFFLFVFPVYRGSLGVRLLKKFEAWSKEMGAKRIRLSTRECLGDRSKDLFEALGYNHEESIFFKEVA